MVLVVEGRGRGRGEGEGVGSRIGMVVILCGKGRILSWIEVLLAIQRLILQKR